MSSNLPFSPATASWFDDTFDAATPVQRAGWSAIMQGAHTLLVAPTGSGKTLAAFLAGVDYCITLPADAAPGTRVLYISPLKALVYDVERNLRAPLVGIGHRATAIDQAVRPVQVDIRTGDTPQKERQRQAKQPADILVTTPESLFLLLGSKARENLRSVHTVIIDEIHALAPTKRGAHLALSLERLSDLCPQEPQRVGLSATVRPLDEVARFLGGRRKVETVDLSAKPSLDLEVTVPVPDMENPGTPAQPRGGSILGELYTRELSAQQPAERGIWPAIYPQLLRQVNDNRATIIFVNSRGLCERLTQRLNELAGEELVRSHHGSVSHEKRAEIEEGLKQGRIKGIVATSSLELGIDMGAVDRVVLVESPGSVARGLQRVGRAGHQVGERSVGRIFPKFRGDLLECTVISQRMLDGDIEPLKVPRNTLDVLAQQIVAMCCDEPCSSERIERLVTRAYPFQQLSGDALQAVLEMLSGHYPSQDFADLRPLLAWDRNSDELRPRRGTAMISRMNAGTIPDRGNYTVTLGPDGGRLGELDEEMVFETRPGENILLGASTWRVEEITRDRVIVSPAPGEPGKLPFWRGDGPGRPIELGRALGAFVRKLGAMSQKKAVDWLQQQAHLDAHAARNLAGYLAEQKEHTGCLPTDKSITIERFRDELGDWRICILSPFGARVHAPWSMALQQRLSVDNGFEVQVMYTDDGVVLRFADIDSLPELETLLPDPDEVEELVTDQLAHTAMFAGLFRENAARSLLLPRRRVDQRTPLWAQRLKAQNLLAAVRKYANFPIVLETYRQALSDIFDIQALRALLSDIRARRVLVDEVETRSASPFARSLVFAYVAAYIYEQDAPLAERRAQALTLDRNLLGELLGQAELRELIDGEVLQQLEQELQRLVAARHARDADEVHDLLRQLGDLDEKELAQRADCDVSEALARLQHERRAILVKLAGRQRWIAAENAAIYRDALGAMPPPGLPEAFVEAHDRPLEFLTQRYARTHGPFLSRDIADRFGLRPAQIEPVLRALLDSGTLVQGEIRPGGVEPDWCDAEILRRLKRRTLAKLRDAVAPVEATTLALFLPRWHRLGEERAGPARLIEVIQQLQGLELPWTALRDHILPTRVAGFTLDMLDMLAASGQVVWVGRAPLGTRDGRIALYLREQVHELLDPASEDDELDAPHRLVLDHLRTRGASFTFEIESVVQKAFPEIKGKDLQTLLWDLVWNEHISNDTFAPLRTLGARSTRSSGRRGRVASTLAGGRWSLVEHLVDASVTDTERTLARANMLLDRYGVVSREVVQAEDIRGGFGPLYKMLSTLEESGRVRRGYFIEGLSGAQFARPGTVDMIRGVQPDDSDDIDDMQRAIDLVPVIDPANPWGSLLPWPATGAAESLRPRRVAGAWLLMHRGTPLLYLGPNGRQLITFPAQLDRPEIRSACFEFLRSLPGTLRRGTLVIEKIDGVPVTDSPYRDAMLQAGFVSDYRGVAAEAFG
ncbi:MAG: DEAD/DEAH box helicase [Gammaproteobacteria bacterium]|nr:DEAD/DEAH box helicase [Gammaproteobacteria bacterium]